MTGNRKQMVLVALFSIPARSTVAVAELVDPDWLIEIEAVAVYPK